MALDSIHLYLQEIGRIPLLTSRQEVEYGRRVQRLVKLQQVQEKFVQRFHRIPTVEEWVRTAQLSSCQELEQILNEGESARRKMIEANLRLVVAVAKRYQKHHMDLLDLIQEGTLGLERGVDKFDPSRGYKFSTYAYWWIRQGITRAISSQSRTIRLPSHITEKLNKIRKAQHELAQQLGRTATLLEIAQVVGLSSAQIREYLAFARHPVSLNQLIGVGEAKEVERQELLPDQRISPDDYMTEIMLREEVVDLLRQLPLQQRKILSLRFGLEDGQALSLSQVGLRLQLSKERVRQLERQALAVLRQCVSSQPQ
jgi:RNA polymerase nonessential primary-like sigma factor